MTAKIGNYFVNKNQIQFIKVSDDFNDIKNWTGIEIFFSNNKITFKVGTTKELEDLENILKNEGVI